MATLSSPDNTSWQYFITKTNQRYALKNHTHETSGGGNITDLPNALPCPATLSLSFSNNTDLSYDGSAEVSISIDRSRIGATASSHTHKMTYDYTKICTIDQSAGQTTGTLSNYANYDEIFICANIVSASMYCGSGGGAAKHGRTHHIKTDILDKINGNVKLAFHDHNIQPVVILSKSGSNLNISVPTEVTIDDENDRHSYTLQGSDMVVVTVYAR